jgi:nucleoside-diphosphate-sugar epimerase
VLRSEPIDLATGWVNVIWQGDANAVALRSIAIAGSPPAVLNVTGPEALSIRSVALRFGAIFGREPRFVGVEEPTAFLSDASRANLLFGPYRVTVEQAIEWTAEWLKRGGPSLDKPTHFDARDGAF